MAKRMKTIIDAQNFNSRKKEIINTLKPEWQN
jgi:hypothetical protein